MSPLNGFKHENIYLDIAYRFCWKNFCCFLHYCWRNDLWRRFYQTFYSSLSVFLNVTICFSSILNLSLNYLHFWSSLLRIVALLRLNLTVLKQTVVKYTDVNAVFLKLLACTDPRKTRLTYIIDQIMETVLPPASDVWRRYN